jgi:phycocyanin-associated, rod
MQGLNLSHSIPGEIAVMLGQSGLTRNSGSVAGDRIFVYEVAGLSQNDQTENHRYVVRHSSNVTVQVPYSRMNDEMQRIIRLGGKIVGIHPLNKRSNSATSATSEVTESR